MLIHNLFQPNSQPRTVCFAGKLHGDDMLLALVQAWQASTEHHLQRPAGF